MKSKKLELNSDIYCDERKSYRYPPARLIESHIHEAIERIEWGDMVLIQDIPSREEWTAEKYRRKQSSMRLDAFHTKLLNSEDCDEILHGILSVQYWGNAAGRDGRLTGFALKRARWLVDGKGRDIGGSNRNAPQKREEIVEYFRDARRALRDKEIAVALKSVVRIKFLGMAFATKVLAFTDPLQAGVYDKVISEWLISRPSLAEMGISTGYTTSRRALEAQAETYEKWCHFCQNQAELLNDAKVLWTDWDEKKYKWRAIDIERAHFSLAAKAKPSVKATAQRKPAGVK